MTQPSVLIFGKEGCPYTRSARDDYEARGYRVDYVDVKLNAAELTRMLEYSRGRRSVPVIVEGDRVEVGYGGS